MESDLEKRVRIIEERNKHVEQEKKWESHPLRILSVSLLTYFIEAFVLYLIHDPKPFLSAIIPTVGFILSVQLVTTVRKILMRKK